MANEYAVNAVDLQAVAEAIRQKTGKTDSLQFPDGFVSEVGAILSAEGVTLQLKGLIDGTATEITIPDGVTNIRRYAFSYVSAMEKVYIPAGVTSIETQAFSYCSKLEYINLPVGLKTIGGSAFYQCIRLPLTELPDEITTIESNAFTGCAKLAITKIPAGVTHIKSNAFSSCGGLTSITFRGVPNEVSSTAFNYDYNIQTINVPWAEGAVSGAPWGATKATINYNYTGG